MLILEMYLTLLSVILGGILNMLFVKTSFYQKHKYPIDNNKILKDGKRLFGNNKTWIGFLSMIICCIITQCFVGFVCYICNINQHNQLYNNYDNNLIFNIITGSLFGFMYMLFELPNSFIKRRLNIQCGKTNSNTIGKLFFIIDQIDSLFGVVLILVLFSKISIYQYFGYILLGGLTHISVNLILYKLKIRRNL